MNRILLLFVQEEQNRERGQQVVAFLIPKSRSPDGRWESVYNNKGIVCYYVSKLDAKVNLACE